MKKSLADKIEQYIKVLIERSDNQEIIIQRAELAETFGCVPSQVTYVINTRFTEDEGYMAESRRGGKGYVRITKFIHEDDLILEACRNDLFAFINLLYEKGDVTKGEYDLLAHLFTHAFNDLKPRDQSFLYKNMVDILDDFFK